VYQKDNEAGRNSTAEYDPHMIPKSTVKYESKGAQIKRTEIVNSEGRVVNILKNDEQYFYSYMAEFETDADEVRFGMLIKTIKGIEISGYSALLDNRNNGVRAGETYIVKFPFTCVLNPGVYFLNAGILATLDGEHEYLDRQLDIAMFRVEEKKDLSSTGLMSIVGCPNIESV
jgi:lipopolysaccharide transport system ATP-binding protein